MEHLFQVVYTSTATAPFNHLQLVQLLEKSSRGNRAVGITGLLLYSDGAFMQVLEGEESKVIALFRCISRDPRHHNIIPLLHERIEQRFFPDSAMAFHDLNSSEVHELPGYSEFLNTPLNGDLLAKDIPKCKRLLLMFKQNIR